MVNVRSVRTTFCALVVAVAGCTGCNAAIKGPVPVPAVDDSLAKAPAKETAVFAGGCFWGTQSVF